MSDYCKVCGSTLKSRTTLRCLEMEGNEVIHCLAFRDGDICISCVFDGMKWAAEQGAKLLTSGHVAKELGITLQKATRAMRTMPHVELPDKTLRVSGRVFAEWLSTRQRQPSERSER